MRINATVDRWIGGRGSGSITGSSAEWQTAWNNRAVADVDLSLDYIVGYSNANSAAGYYSFIRDCNRSTANQSSGAAQLRGIPSQAWRNFVTDRAAMTENGATDAAQGRRVYELLTGTRGADYRHPGSGAREILCAWAGAGVSSALGSS